MIMYLYFISLLHTDMEQLDLVWLDQNRNRFLSPVFVWARFSKTESRETMKPPPTLPHPNRCESKSHNGISIIFVDALGPDSI